MAESSPNQECVSSIRQILHIIKQGRNHAAQENNPIHLLSIFLLQKEVSLETDHKNVATYFFSTLYKKHG